MAETHCGTKEDVLRILEICREIEECMAGLYHYYAEIFSDTPDMSKLWEKTAREEENHANQFALAINLRRQGVVQAVNTDLFTAETILNKLKSIYATVKQTRPAIADALRSAIKIEEKLAAYHMSSLALFQDESYRKLFEAMMKNDQGHIVSLERAFKTVMEKPL
ncbi:ferritin family protein [Geobacter benzoatilyticus]|jgi:rubrerythrin|uniref:Rubrerythrin n=1 Tax=Geobacter benzoatilyticus TaxID=2815309 RepID=A0ABX7Q5B3_9BACT|nr:ferritin family protein [Geobacter benzoatilyticus]QSV46629.1 rubrerythrin [Geobacter benzoatilyticus]